MNYLNITHCDQVNYRGNRVVLWVSGCSHRCKGCQNPFSWDCGAGVPFDDKAKEEIFCDLTQDWCAGITYSGGDPMFTANRAAVISLAAEIHERFPDKNQCLYTGYTWDEIINDPTMCDIVRYVDVIIDGPFVESLRDVNLEWVGSSNQQVIDVKRRLQLVTSLAGMRKTDA